MKTRRLVGVLCAVSTLMILPALLWRFTIERSVMSIALGGLALVPATLAYRGLRVLGAQEQQHPEPTAAMTFIFMVVAVYPVAINVLLLILLTEM